MTIAAVATWTGLNNGAGGGSSPLTNVGQTTSGSPNADLIVAEVTSSGVINSVSDNKGNTYTKATGSAFANGGGDQVSIWYCLFPNVGTGHTLSANWTGSQFVVLCGRAYSGLDPSAFDVHKEGTGTGTALDSGTAPLTAVADELLIAGGTVSAGSDLTFTGTGGWTVRSQSGQASITTVGFLADRIVSATGTYNATVTSSQSGPWACGLVSFKALAVAGAVIAWVKG